MNPDKRGPARRIDPGNRKYWWKLWVRRHSTRGKFIHFFWGKILVTLPFLLLLGWMAVAGAVILNVRTRRGVKEARYVDLVCPWRWNRYFDTLSSHYVAQGTDALQHGQADSALYFSTAALALRPNHPAARQLAAFAQFRMGQKPTALHTLAIGVPAALAAGNADYVRSYFFAALSTQADDAAYETGKAALPAAPDQNELNAIVAYQVATACFNRCRYDEAIEWVNRWSLRRFPDGAVLYARILWESGRRDTAEQYLHDHVADFPHHDGLLVAEEQLSRGDGRLDEARHAATLRQLEAPAQFAPQIDLLYANHAVGKSADEHRAIQTYLATFRTDAPALARLMQFALETRQLAVAEQIEMLGRNLKLPVPVFGFQLAEVAIAVRDFDAAARALARIKAAQYPASQPLTAALTAFDLLVQLNRTHGDSAGLAFSNWLPGAPAMGVAEAVRAAGYLRAEGQPGLSRQLLVRICAAYPDDEPALVDLVQAGIAAHDQAFVLEHLPVLLKMRKVPREVLTEAMPGLSGKAAAGLRAEVAAALAHTPPAYLPVPWTGALSSAELAAGISGGPPPGRSS